MVSPAHLLQALYTYEGSTVLLTDKGKVNKAKSCPNLRASKHKPQLAFPLKGKMTSGTLEMVTNNKRDKLISRGK